MLSLLLVFAPGRAELGRRRGFLVVSEGSREQWADLATVDGTDGVLLGSSGGFGVRGFTLHVAVGTEACRASGTPTLLMLAPHAWCFRCSSVFRDFVHH